MNKIRFSKQKLPSSDKVRLAQAILQYSSGAMVDFPDRTLMTAAPYTWETDDMTEDGDTAPIIDDPRFAHALKVDGFSVPAHLNCVKFPEWYFCPVCRRFQPLSEWEKEYQADQRGNGNAFREGLFGRRKRNQKIKGNTAFKPQCSRRECHKSILIPARVVVACEHGHIDDFPWVKWVHYRNIGGAMEPCCKNPVLIFEAGGGSETGEDIRIRCSECGAEATLKGAFTAGVFDRINDALGKKIFACTGRLPDYGIQSSPCEMRMVAMQRGAASLHFPMVRSSVVIPMPTNKREKDIDVDDLAYRWQEYQVLRGYNGDGDAICDDESEGLSRMPAVPLPEYERLGNFHLAQVELIDKVNIVKACLGYSRVRPAASRDDAGFVHSRLPQDRTYPAYQVSGEGIFLCFNEEDIKKWIALTPKAVERAALLERNRGKSFLASNNHAPITAKFLMLHTLAHLLIKELSLECGYNAAGLSERIYCADKSANQTDFNMAGIFIYVAGGDSEGTLGGLVRQGRQDTLPKIFKRALERARFCSNDPLCGGSHGQGMDGQNLAACHACALLPETSCEEFNVFIDRGVVVGTMEEPGIGFFGGEWENQ